MSIAAHFLPAASVAGDWWFYDRLENGTVRVVLGDVTGHGPAAAMIGAVIAGWYRRMRLDALYGTPEILRRLHEGMREPCAGRYMMPLSAVEVDVSGAMRVWSAAAPPVLIRRAGGEVQVLQQSGLPIGAESFQASCSEARLNPGDRVLIASDGLFERPTHGRRVLGVRRVREVLAASSEPILTKARDELAANFDALSADVREDDLTFVLVGFDGSRA